MSERAKKQDGEKDSFVVFRDKSYIEWEGHMIPEYVGSSILTIYIHD